MKTRTGGKLLFVLLAACIAGALPAAAADVNGLVWILERPQAPPQRHPKIPLRDWETKKDEAWVQLRLDAQKQLARAGAEAVQPLVDLIKRTSEDQVRISALTALASMEKPRDLQPAAAELTAFLSHQNAAVRYLTIKILGQTRHRPAVPELQKLAADKQEAVRLAVADALGQIGDAAGASVLLDLMEDEDKGVGLHAVRAQGSVGIALLAEPNGRETVDVVSKLIEKLRAQDINCQNAAAAAILDMLGYDLAGDGRWLLAPDQETKAPIIDELQKWWTATSQKREFRIPGAPELTLRVNIASDRQQSKTIRLKAVEMLRRLSDKRAADYLILILPEPDKDIRRAAASAASELSGIKFSYNPSDTEPVWMNKIEDFRRRWEQVKTKKDTSLVRPSAGPLPVRASAPRTRRAEPVERRPSLASEQTA